MNWTQALTQEQLDANHLAGENYITQLMETPGEHKGNEKPLLATAQQCICRQLHVTQHICGKLHRSTSYCHNSLGISWEYILMLWNPIRRSWNIAEDGLLINSVDTINRKVTTNLKKKIKFLKSILCPLTLGGPCKWDPKMLTNFPKAT